MSTADAAARLEAILVEENAALERFDAIAATSLLNQKLEAAQSLSAEGLSLETVERLRALAAENRRLLERAMDVQKRIVAMVARAAQAAPASSRYGAGGRTVQPDSALALIRQA